ncbi:MAG: hypothetical protein KOO62_12965 [candidate division Zixibacteria bacterium]|nr:hypothetical protein [candidate division Zixibacteria bacterium]
MALNTRLKKAEELLYVLDPSTQTMSRELFDLTVSNMHQGLDRFGYPLLLDQVRRLVWWSRGTDSGRTCFGFDRVGMCGRVEGDPSDYGIENFSPDDFLATDAGFIVNTREVCEEVAR